MNSNERKCRTSRQGSKFSLPKLLNSIVFHSRLFAFIRGSFTVDHKDGLNTATLVSTLRWKK